MVQVNIMSKSKDAMNKSWSQAMVTDNIKTLTILGLTVVILLQQFVINRAPVEVKINPTTLTETAIVRGNDANPVYKQSWALAMAELVGNINPKNVEFMKDAIVPILSPRLQVDLSRQIDETVTIIRAKNITQIFIVNNMYHNTKNDVIYIWGDKKSFIGNEAASSVKWTYEFKIGVHNGSPRILHVDQYLGTPAKQIKASDLVDDNFLPNSLKDAMGLPMTQEEKRNAVDKTQDEMEQGN
jgi:conjugal transfer pilus assembly protein TraE